MVRWMQCEKSDLFTVGIRNVRIERGFGRGAVVCLRRVGTGCAGEIAVDGDFRGAWGVRGGFQSRA